MRAIWLTVYCSLWLTSALTYCPEKCDCVWESNYSLVINCSDKGFRFEPYNIDQNVAVLDLSNNEISEYIDPRVFPSMTSINLSHNKITKVRFHRFFTNLQTIDLSHNQIADLGHVHVQLDKLKCLNLSHNTKLNKFGSLYSPTLEILILKNCFIRFFSDNALKNLTNIKKIDLSFNSFRNIMELQSETLEELDISNGNVRYLTNEHLNHLPNLKKLNVSNNKNLELYFQNTTNCFNLTEIDLSNCEIKPIDPSPFCNLEIANYSVNHIEKIDETTFEKNFELTFLNLSRNEIKSIGTKSFRITEKITTLDLSHNQIDDLKFTMFLQNVEFLNLSNNNIKNLDNLVLKNGIGVDISHNNIYQVEIDFRKFVPKMRDLNLSYNLIEILTRIKSRSIVSLNLSYCQIVSIVLNAFSDMKDLQELNLMGNKLVSLNHLVFAGNNQLKILMLSHNPWSCECKNEKFKNLYEFVLVNKSLVRSNELHCNQKYNETWLSFCGKEWKQEQLSLISKDTFYILLITFVLVLMVIGAVVFCRCLREKIRTDGMISDFQRDSYSSRGSLRAQEVLRRVYASSDVSRENSEMETAPRTSTPPPNYEDALLLPKLSKEQKEYAMSSLTNIADVDAQLDDTESYSTTSGPSNKLA